MDLSPVQILILSSFSLLTASAQLMFKKASMTLPPLNSFSNALLMTINPWLIGAILMNVLAIILWVIVLQKTPLSVAYPFAALAFVFVPLFAWFFFQEHLNLWQIAGIGFIISGIIIVSFKTA